VCVRMGVGWGGGEGIDGVEIEARGEEGGLVGGVRVGRG